MLKMIMIYLFQYKKYILYALMGCILCLSYTSSYGQVTEKLYIGKSPTGSIGYLFIQTRPINQIYTVLNIKNIQCSNFVQGYTERQANRFILRTDIPDPRKDDQHQCQVIFIQKNQNLLVTNEQNCFKLQEAGCSFTSMSFSPTPLSGQ